jgi:predicted XRE-type DNA-binding protein
MTSIDFSYLSQRNRKYPKATVIVANGAQFSVLKIAETEKRQARNILYLHVHRKNRKCYVGVTVMAAGDRWAVGAGYQKNRRFGHSIRKHGWGAFDSFVLAFGKDRMSLHAAEIAAIAAAGGHKSQFTYNLSPGGDVVAENDKPIVGFCFKTRKIHHFKSGVDAARRLGMKNADMPMAVARGERSSVAGWWFRFKDDSITEPPASWGEVLRIEAVRLKQGKKVIAVNYATGVEKLFPTTAAAAKAMGVEQSQVSAIATGAGLSAKGVWFKFEGDTRKIPTIHGQKAGRLTRDRKVYAQNLKTGAQRIFRNCTAADTNLEIYKGAAASVASGKRVSAAGWWFSYDNTASPPKDYKAALVAKARSKPVIATNIKTGLEQEFYSAKSAAEALEMSRASISHVISGKKKAAKGYKFRLSK